MGLKWGLWAAGGLSGLLRGYRTGWQRAAVAPDVASSPLPRTVWSSLPAGSIGGAILKPQLRGMTNTV